MRNLTGTDFQISDNLCPSPAARLDGHISTAKGLFPIAFSHCCPLRIQGRTVAPVSSLPCTTWGSMAMPASGCPGESWSCENTSPEDAAPHESGPGLRQVEAIHLFFSFSFSTSLKDSLILHSNTVNLVFLPDFFSSLNSEFAILILKF